MEPCSSLGHCMHKNLIHAWLGWDLAKAFNGSRQGVWMGCQLAGEARRGRTLA